MERHSVVLSRCLPLLFLSCQPRLCCRFSGGVFGFSRTLLALYPFALLPFCPLPFLLFTLLFARSAVKLFLPIFINKRCVVAYGGFLTLQCPLGQASVNGAVRGTTIRRTVALPTATLTLLPTATLMSVFGWCVRFFQHSSTIRTKQWELFGRIQKSPDLFR